MVSLFQRIMTAAVSSLLPAYAPTGVGVLPSSLLYAFIRESVKNRGLDGNELFG
jgi:hypothetical protein